MLGSNVPTVGGLLKAFEWADRWECDCIQIYVTPSRTWSVPDLEASLVSTFRSMLQDGRVQTAVAHVPFLVNLASPDDEQRVRSIDRLVTELLRCSALGVQCAVLHPGSAKGAPREAAMSAVATSLAEVFSRSAEAPVRLCLETMSGQGSTLGGTFEEIAWLLDAVQDGRLSVCVDTAHVFQAGYNLSGVEGYNKVVKRLDDVIGLDRVGVIHCNDSSTQLGSRRDRHAVPGDGFLGVQTFWALLRDERMSKVPKILEIPDRDSSPGALRTLRRLAQLANAPAETAKWQEQLRMEV